MINYKKSKIRLTKIGKIVFSASFIILTSMIFMVSKLFYHKYHIKEEKSDYIVEINFPKLKNKNLISYSKNYINTKKKEFKQNINNLNNSDIDKYQFRANYQLKDDNELIGLHLTIYEYTGGSHQTRYDKSYYYSKKENKIVSLVDFLENEESLEKLSNLAYYYIMKYSKTNNLNIDEDMPKEGLKSEIFNFENFEFLDDGLSLIFPPLQVAYHAAGEIKITIPYSDLNGIIKSEYLKYSNKQEINNNNRNIEEFKNKKLIAFTFDDGPSYIGTNKLLDNLDKYNARVTFFVLGSRVIEHKTTLKRAHDMGNLIGSHTYNHLNLLNLDNYSITNEIKNTNEVIKEIIKEEPVFLRPPYGNINQNIKNISNMYTILWNLDTEDWKYKNAEKISNYIVDNAKDGSIVLLHDLYETSVDGALLAMEKLEKEGYAFVTIAELAKLKNIELKKEKSYYQINN